MSKEITQSWIDLGIQRAYRMAYLGMRVWWNIAHPDTRGVFVGFWLDGRVLLIRNSYLDYYSFPGGGVKKGEPFLYGAVRECREEVGLTISPFNLIYQFEMFQQWEGKNDSVCMYQYDLQEEPDIQIDRREVIAAEFYSPEEALNQALFPPVRRHIEQVLSAS